MAWSKRRITTTQSSAAPSVAKPTLSLRGAGQCPDFEIEFGRGAAVECELGLARLPPQSRGGEIEIGIFYRAFELIGVLAGEKDQRGMGFDDVDPVDRRSIRGRSAQKIDDVALIVGHSLSQTQGECAAEVQPLLFPGKLD